MNQKAHSLELSPYPGPTDRLLSKGQLGFTLIELLVSLAIIGILCMIATTRFYIFKVNAYDATAEQDLRYSVTSQEAAFADTQTYVACASPDECEEVLPGFRASRFNDGSPAMNTFDHQTHDTSSYTARSKHFHGSGLFQYESATSTFSKN